MTGLLDASILVGLEQDRLSPAVLPAEASICVVTLEELWLGVLRADDAVAPRRRETYRLAIESFVAREIDVVVAQMSAVLRAEGRSRGRRYRLADSLIGATARVHGLTLFTQDEGMTGMLGVDVQLV